MKKFLKRNVMDLIIITLWVIDLVFTTQNDASALFIICLIVAQIRIVVNNETIEVYKHDRGGDKSE